MDTERTRWSLAPALAPVPAASFVALDSTRPPAAASIPARGTGLCPPPLPVRQALILPRASAPRGPGTAMCSSVFWRPARPFRQSRERSETGAWGGGAVPLQGGLDHSLARDRDEGPTRPGLERSVARDPSWGLTRSPLDRGLARDSAEARRGLVASSQHRSARLCPSGAVRATLWSPGKAARRQEQLRPHRAGLQLPPVRCAEGRPPGHLSSRDARFWESSPRPPESADLLHPHPLCAGLPAFPAGLRPWAPRRRREGGWGSPPSRCAEAADGSQRSQSCLGACGHEWQAGVSGGILGTQVRSNFR